MVFNIRCTFRWRTRAEPDRFETMLLIKLTGSIVLLMCMKFESFGVQTFREDDETCSPTFAPFTRIDVHPIDIRAIHCKEGNNLLV